MGGQTWHEGQMRQTKPIPAAMPIRRPAFRRVDRAKQSQFPAGRVAGGGLRRQTKPISALPPAARARGRGRLYKQSQFPGRAGWDGTFRLGNQSAVQTNPIPVGWPSRCGGRLRQTKPIPARAGPAPGQSCQTKPISGLVDRRGWKPDAVGRSWPASRRRGLALANGGGRPTIGAVLWPCGG
jgi:hypothetical protein